MITETLEIPETLGVAEDIEVLRQLFREQRENVDFFFDHVDLEKTAKLVDLMRGCEGNIFMTGIGKSGIIAKKIATTLVSTGTRALYLSAVDSMHGDLGIVRQDDLLIMLSKSGESDELLNLLPFVRCKGARTVAIVSNPSGRLGKLCDLSVELPVKRELCPFDLAPTTSAAIQLLFGDILVVALMKRKNFSLDEYAGNHPAGRIGKRITLRVRDVMVTGEDLPVCGPDHQLGEILADFSGKRCGCMLVTNGSGELLGIFTDGDLRRALQSSGSNITERTMGSLMTSTPITVSPQSLAFEAMQKMEKNPRRLVYVLPVVEEGKAVGLIKMHDIVQLGL